MLGSGASMALENCCLHCTGVDEISDKLTSVLVEQGRVAENARGLQCALARHEQSVTESLTRIEDGMVTRHEYKPVRALVYGLVGLVMTGFVYALITKAIPPALAFVR